MGFEAFHLDKRLVTALTRLKITEPTPIQTEAIPVALAGGDLVGTARTGTGKTLAFALPLLQQLLTRPALVPHKTRVLILAPTRELALQIQATFTSLLPGLPLRVASIFGGVGYGPQQDALRKGTDIIVACPGRLLDHLQNKIADLSHVEHLILDEADQMFDMGFLPPVRRIVGHMPKQRQTLLFSATFAPALQELIREVCHNPEKVDVAKNSPARTVTHSVYPVAQHLKVDLLLKVLEKSSVGSTLIFTRTKHRADRIAERLAKAGLKVGALHSNKSQSQRQRALEQFRKGHLQILVATDIAARGIDVAGVTHVINFDMPESATTYIHRIGRTGRAEKEGDAYTLVTPADMGTLRDVERALGKPIERKVAEGFDYAIVATGASNPPGEMFRPERPRPDRGGRSFGGRSSSGGSRGGYSDRGSRGSSYESRAPRSDAPGSSRGEYRSSGPRSDAPRGEQRSSAPRSEGPRGPRSSGGGSNEGRFQLRGPSSSSTFGGSKSSGGDRPWKKRGPGSR